MLLSDDELRRAVVAPPRFLAGAPEGATQKEAAVVRAEGACEWEFLRRAAPSGLYVAPSTDPMVWDGIIFVRHGLHAGAHFPFTVRLPVKSSESTPVTPTLEFTPPLPFHPLVEPESGRFQPEAGSLEADMPVTSLLYAVRRAFYEPPLTWTGDRPVVNPEALRLAEDDDALKRVEAQAQAPRPAEWLGRRQVPPFGVTPMHEAIEQRVVLEGAKLEAAEARLEGWSSAAPSTVSRWLSRGPTAASGVGRTGGERRRVAGEFVDWLKNELRPSVFDLGQPNKTEGK
eukprot:Polyplicarium_translucidae@DN2314_c0_g1_i1.p1